VSRDERALHAALSDPVVPRALAHGALEILGLMPGSSNYTFLASAKEPDGGLDGGPEGGKPDLLAIYKPRRGEQPLWDFPQGTLCRREVAAYVVARSLGWPRVPPTVLREGPEGLGSAQLFVEFDADQHYFTLQEAHADAFREIALFDVVVNNADRKGGHCLLALDGGIFAIDHGVCFHEEDKLRTVIWEFIGEPILPARLDDLERLAEAIEQAAGPLRGELGDLLSAAEIASMVARIDRLWRAGVFPEPGEDRPYPWPPI
jgi:uncharacterized repeat protein (TIGR03843 family)